MKRFLIYIVFLLFISNVVSSQTTYTWNVASGSWATSTNWNPARTTPSVDDILVFDGSTQAAPTVTNVPTESIGALRFINNVSANINAAAINSVAIGNTSVSTPQFSVDAGSFLTVSGASALTFSISSTFSGDVYGNISFGGAAHQLVSADANSIHFKNGSVFTANTGFTGSAFGAANLNSVIFESGSKYITKAGAAPFGAAAPNSVVVFQTGSLFSYQANLAPSLSGRTYANFEINSATFNQADMTAANPFRCDTLTITNVNTANFNLTGGIIISGDLKVLSGIVSFSPASANTILFDGNVKQTVSGSFSLNSNTQIAIADNAFVDLQSDLSTPDSTIVYGKLYTNAKTVFGTYFGLHPSAGAAITTGDITINNNTIINVTNASNFLPGTPITGSGIPSGTYVLNGYGTTLKISRFATSTISGVTLTPATSISTLGIGATEGIRIPPNTGNIQTTIRFFQPDANYIYNGAIAQVTGDALPTTITGSLKINNSSVSGVALSLATTVTGIFEIINGNTTLLFNDLTVNAITQTGAATMTNNHIITAAGNLTIKAVGTGPVNFPVGPSSSSLNMVSISNGQGADYSVRANAGIFPSIAFPTYGINRTWHVFASAVTLNVTVAFQYAASDANPGVTPQPQAMEILQRSGSAWSIIPGNAGINPTGTNPYKVTTAIGLTINNSDVGYALGKDGGWILPIDCIISTRAQKINNTGIISWTVNSCSEVRSFEVQRSVNNSGFQTIGIVNPMANQTDFNFTDAALAGGRNLYRIKVNGITGSSKYSNTVVLIHNSNDILISFLVPNPVHDKALLTVSSGRNAAIDLKIYNAAGNLVKQWSSAVNEGNNIIEVNAEGLAAGMYTVFASSNKSTILSRFVKQ